MGEPSRVFHGEGGDMQAFATAKHLASTCARTASGWRSSVSRPTRSTRACSTWPASDHSSLAPETRGDRRLDHPGRRRGRR
jgi:hypothetical protein